MPGTEPVSVPSDSGPEEEIYTIEEAIRDTPPDPEPKEEPEYKVKPTVRITAAVRRDVEGKLAFVLAMTGQGISMPDPVCGSALLENSGEIAKKLTPVVCQSPELVRWFTKSGKFMIWLDLFMAFWPVLQVVYAHHVSKVIAPPGAMPYNGQGATPDMYVVQ